VGILFFKEARVKETLLSYMISVAFFSFIVGRIFRMIQEFVVGYPEDTLHYTGFDLQLQLGYTIFSFIGIVLVFYSIERKLQRNTHYFLSILAVVTAGVVITNHLLPLNISYPFFTYVFVYPFWLSTIFILPIFYSYIAIKSTGKVRRNAIIIVIGMLMFEFSIAFNSPEAQSIFQRLGPFIIWWGGPILQTLSCFFIHNGIKIRS
jgi:hypothetical protein